jgi:hypothetical protein
MFEKCRYRIKETGGCVKFKKMARESAGNVAAKNINHEIVEKHERKQRRNDENHCLRIFMPQCC